MISRQTWRDAVRASGLPASRRAVLLDMADYWPTGTTRPVLWVSQVEVSNRTGLSVATVKRAWRDAEQAGLLVLVEAHRQHRSPRWAPTIPAPQTGHSDRSEHSQGGQPDRSEPVDNSPRPVTVHPRPVTVTADPIDPPQHHHHGAREDLPVPAGLAMVVVEALPQDLAQQITRSRLAKALAPAAAAGWTPEQLTAATTGRPWAGAGAGAVIRWAEELGPAPTPAAPPAPERRCPIHEVRFTNICHCCRADSLAGTG